MGILDKFHLDGKLALVTGSATGLGAAIAIALSHRCDLLVALCGCKPSKSNYARSQITTITFPEHRVDAH